MRSTGLQLNRAESRFECKRCGACCKDRDVPLTLDDIFRLSEFLNMDPDSFYSQYCVEVAKGDNTIALPYLRRDDGACCFLEDNICQAHFAKPTVCLNTPSTIFGSIEHIRARMPPSCAIHHTRIPESADNERKRRNYMTAMMLTTIYYSKFGTFKYQLSKPFIYRILLFRRNREQIYNFTGNNMASN
ncbi:conserved hypothetical protein [Methanocella paludicola SANAE]|uniref:YkgJ family cysteine cluster protein n=1 Tax=Methanocella paludicola (strain DSM 17711 / JCM 13418 / NBRC 101707 / SANAE) TaxID=304371 RepID=D1YYN7_METPS|nr:YkgJ family cysteine cluster protein [Methanocella paludicola]BAI61559.1 conserved hypothetical protein [Methanocella paludicola SANAE]